jgi:hypothetical protein
MAAAHAPKGGVSVQGKEYKGGEFIPGDVMDKATEEEKKAIKGGEKPKGKPRSAKPKTKATATKIAKVNSWAKEKFGSDEKAENFTKWFGDSKIVNESGEPIVVYHGASQKFDEFKISGRRDAGWHGPGHYFYAKESWAKGYGKEVMPVYLSIKNPAIRKTSDIAETPEESQALREKLIAAGHDGVLAYDSDGTLADIVAFHPNQIKSATDNKGTFDPKSNKIAD